MWNRFLPNSRAFRLQLVGALLTICLLSLLAMSCSTSSGGGPISGGGGSGNGSGRAGAGNNNPGAGTGAFAGAAVQCPVCPATQVCLSNATCGCAAGQSLCGQSCINLSSDNANCGACGTACPTGTAPFCSNSQCVSMCPTGTTTCSSGCVNTQTDNANCGSCTHPCSGGQTCTGGVCLGGAGGASGGGAGGTTGVGGGSSTAGSGGSDRPAGCPAPAPAVLSDFEEGQSVLVKQPGRTGWWYVFNDSPAGQTTGMQTPPNSVGPIAATLLPATDTPPPTMCNKYGLHSTASGHPSFVGFGATFIPGATAANKQPLSLAAYTGVSFKIRSGASGTAPNVWFEFLNKETQPGAACTLCGVDLSGTGKNPQVDAFNTRGRLLKGITSSWQTMYVPFATLAPRYVPGACGAGVFCEAPSFNPASTLGFQFSLYDQFPTAGATAGAYDLWVDDVTLTTGDTGLPPVPAGTGKFPFPQDKPLANGCVKPTGASGKALIEAFNNWKAGFVTADGGNLRVKFDQPAVTVSEGIAYGMLITVFMDDKATFDGLLGYWKAHASGDSMLMTWRIGGAGGTGSAVDADEDAAFALLQAAKQWTGGTYAADAQTILTQIRTKELDPGTFAVRPGNAFPTGASALTNPSYFAPAYYRIFATADKDAGAAAAWNGAAASSLTYLSNILKTASNGLVPAWCTNSCASRGGGGYADADKYQYDAHRTPWRMALDACWNGTQAAKDYATTITGFFSGKASTLGIGGLADEYSADGSACTTCSIPAQQNSMSLIGAATAGAMATGAANQAFVDRGWHFILDGAYTADPTFHASGYTYYNATVGLLMGLTLTGNFSNL